MAAVGRMRGRPSSAVTPPGLEIVLCAVAASEVLKQTPSWGHYLLLEFAVRPVVVIIVEFCSSSQLLLFGVVAKDFIAFVVFAVRSSVRHCVDTCVCV